VRGIVLGCARVGGAGYQLTVDDGTGRMGCVIWTEESSTFDPVHIYNKYVSIMGQLIGFRSDIQIRADSWSIVTDTEEPTEEGMWWLDVQTTWESLAVGSTARLCPCMCHVHCGGCTTLGDSTSWNPAFSRAVLVISTALRSLAAMQPSGVYAASLLSLTQLVKDNMSRSPAVNAHPCFPKCATSAAVHQLMRWKCATGTRDKYFIRPPVGVQTDLMSQVPPRYPCTPAGESVDPGATVNPQKFRPENAKFSVASSPWQ
jgi:hypothetical protein